MAKKIKFMDCSFRDGFQSCLGARVKTDDFLPALEAAVKAGISHIEIGGGARFQSLYFYCQEDAFEMMDKWRATVGPDVNLQTLSRGVNVVGLSSQSSDIIDLHAKLFKKHGMTTIRNFDALNDVRNLDVSGKAIAKYGLKHQITVTMMGLAPNLHEEYAHTPKFYIDRLKEILASDIPFDSVAFKDASGTSTPATVYETIKQARALIGKDKEIQFHTHDTAGMAVACNMAAIEAGADVIDLAMAPLSGGTCEADILTMFQRLRGTEYTLDIDPEKILGVEKIFKDCLKKYFMPPESMQVSPEIIFSPMPGGALTANTQMMRDNNCLDKYDACIAEMREVVAKGGFGTSVTPVSQFYFQQAFRNAVMGKNADGSWKLDPKGYGKMVLGTSARPRSLRIRRLSNGLPNSSVSNPQPSPLLNSTTPTRRSASSPLPKPFRRTISRSPTRTSSSSPPAETRGSRSSRATVRSESATTKTRRTPRPPANSPPPTPRPSKASPSTSRSFPPIPSQSTAKPSRSTSRPAQPLPLRRQPQPDPETPMKSNHRSRVPWSA